jgi:phosphate transport system protein
VELVEGLNNQVVRELLTYMMSDPKTIKRAVQLMIVCRCLERIADHATNIAEDVIFMVDALVIKHHADTKGEKDQADQKNPERVQSELQIQPASIQKGD